MMPPDSEPRPARRNVTWRGTYLPHYVAYLCFVPPALAALLTIVNPPDMNSAAGFGFLVLFPLFLVSCLSVPVGLILGFIIRNDIGLNLVIGASVLVVPVVWLFDGTPHVQNFLVVAYGVFVLVTVVGSFIDKPAFKRGI
jgi:hypothetical protein